MSLIFEALKKLEREKRVPDRGFLVVAPNPWPERRASTLRLALGGLGLLVGGALVGGWLRARPADPVQPAASGPAPATLAARATATVPTAPEATNQPTAFPGPPADSPPVQKPEPSPAVVETPPPAAEVAAAPESAADDPAPEVVARRTALEPEVAAGAAPALTPGTLRLEAISSRDGEPVAIIDGLLVHEGDRVGDALVVRIGVTDVEIEVDGERRTLTF